MCEVLTKSRLSFMYKMIREIISMPRADSGYPRNFMVNSWVFKDDESKSVAKTNSRHRVCRLLAWRIHAQSLLLAHCVHTHTHTHTHKQTNKQTNKRKNHLELGLALRRSQEYIITYVETITKFLF